MLLPTLLIFAQEMNWGLDSDSQNGWDLSVSAYMEDVEGFESTGVRVMTGTDLSDNWSFDLEIGFNDFDVYFLGGSYSYVRYYQVNSMFGYQFDLAENFSLTPKAGVGLTLYDESFYSGFFFSYTRDVEFTFSAGVDVEYQISESLGLTAGFRSESTSYIDRSGIHIGAKFTF